MRPWTKGIDATVNNVTIKLMMNDVVTFAQALADGTRWRILQLIFNEPMCVCELADILEMPQSSVSSHVQVIRKSGMLESERCEKWVYYRLSPDHRPLLMTVAEFFQASPASENVLKTDAEKAFRRMVARDESCCPLPKTLTKLKPLTPKRTAKTKKEAVL